MKFTKSILSKRAAPAVESEVIDQAKIDQLAAQNADADEVATGGEGIQSAEQKPDTTKDITIAEVDEVIAGETNPIKDDGANKDAGNGTNDEVADDKGVTEVEATELKDETGAAPTDGKPDPEAEENEAVATGEETAASNEDAAAAVAADLAAEPATTEEEAEETAAVIDAAADSLDVGGNIDAVADDDAAANAEEETATQEEQNAEEEAAAAAEDEAAGEPAAAEAEADAAVDDEAAAQEAEIDAAADQAAADAASDVAADPVEPPAVEVEPAADGETTGADEVPEPAGEVTEQPLEEPAAVIVEQPSEEPVGETEIVVTTGDAVDGVQQTEEAAVVTDPVEVPAAVEPAAATPDFVAVAEATDGVVPAVTEVDEAFTAADVIEAGMGAEEPTYEVLSDAVQTYPEVVAVLDNALQNGGISVEAAALLNIFTQRDGIPADMNVATESYGGYARSQTRVAIESIKDSLRQWWNDLRAWLKEQRERFAAWLKSLFDASGALRKNAEAILEKANAAEVDSDATIEFNSMALLGKDGGFSKDLPADLRELTDLINRAYVPLATLEMADCGKAADVIAQLKGDEEVGAVALDLARAFEQSSSAFRSKLTEPGSEDGYRQSRVQLGGYVLRGQVGDNSTDPTLADMTKGDCLVFTKVTDEADVKEVKALSRTDIIDTARAVIGLLDAIEETKKLDGPCKGASTKIDAAGEHLAKMGEGAEVANELQTGLRQVVLALEKETLTPFSKSIKYFSAVARAALVAADKSLPAAEKAEA